MTELILKVRPKPKPRMVKSDKWKKRPIVLKYWAYKDEVLRQAKGYELPDKIDICFHLKMPKSWSKKKKVLMFGKPHQQTPDVDNILKAIFDIFCKNDSHIWSIKATKYWSNEDLVVINEG